MRLTYNQTDDDADVDVFALDKKGRLAWVEDLADRGGLALKALDIVHVRRHPGKFHEYRVTVQGSPDMIGEFIKGFPDTDSVRIS